MRALAVLILSTITCFSQVAARIGTGNNGGSARGSGFYATVGVAQSALWDNLTFHAKLDEASGARTDNKGSKTLTVLNGGPGSATGLQTDAADFEADNGHGLTTTDAASVSFGAEDFTINVWVKPEETNSYRPVFSKGTVNGAAGILEYGLFLDPNVQLWRFEVSDGSTKHTVTASSYGAPPSGVWQMITCTHHNGVSICIRVDGGPENVTGHTTGCNDGSNTLDLSNLSGAFYFDGLVDELSIFREALNNSKVTELYGGGAGNTYP